MTRLDSGQFWVSKEFEICLNVFALGNQKEKKKKKHFSYVLSCPYA